VVTRDKLRALPLYFRNLPMQALPAKLADIVPVNGDWTPDDCHWFTERVFQRQFVSV